MDRGDPRVRALIAEVAATVADQQASLVADIRQAIVTAMPTLLADESVALLASSTEENVAAAIELLAAAGDAHGAQAPTAASDYARRLAQQDVPVTELIRAYRIGQASFIRHYIEEMLRKTDGDHLEGLAALDVVELAATYVDEVVEQVLTTYSEARDGWLRDRSAVLTLRVRALLRGDPIDVTATERTLEYRLDRHQHHVALVLWVPDPVPVDGFVRMRRTIQALQTQLGADAPALFVPADEVSAWAWLPTSDSVARRPELEKVLAEEVPVSIALGEPQPDIDGFRRSHRQAMSARAVALAAGDDHAAVTPFVDVAPIAMLCADLSSARAWVHETLGDLAIDTTRNQNLRDTARVFLQLGSSYTATAEQLYLHRNTAQYRVRKAEEVRGRPLRDGRLDVELALLACHWMRAAVLRSA